MTALRHPCGPIRRPKKIDQQRAGQEQVRPVFDTSYLLRINTIRSLTLDNNIEIKRLQIKDPHL